MYLNVINVLQKRGFIVVSFIIALFLISQTVFAYTITGNAIKTEKAKIEAGITPDSFLYFLDVALDNINLALTFDSGEKARKGLDIARERLIEVREMVNRNKLDAAQAAQREHSNALRVVQNSIKGIEKTSSTQEIEEKIEIEKELEEHKTEIEEITGELKVKIEVEGKITPDQQVLIDSVLANLEGKAGEVEIEIENEKGKTKIEIEQETGKSEEEIEDEIEELEEKIGLKRIRKETSWGKIKDAEEEINETIKELAELNVTDGGINSALDILAQAKEAYKIKNYKEAARLAKQAEEQIDDYKEQFEELEEEEEREIEVEIERNQAKVEVEVAGTKAEFVLETTNRDEIISEISIRTGLNKEEIESLMKFEVEEEEEIEIESEIEEELSKVKLELNETESEFTLNTTDKDEIISEITRRTGLSREQVEKNAEFEIEEDGLEKDRSEEEREEVEGKKEHKKPKKEIEKGRKQQEVEEESEEEEKE